MQISLPRAAILVEVGLGTILGSGLAHETNL